MRTLIVNASQVLTMAGSDAPRRGTEMSSLGLTRNGAVLVADGKIVAAGLSELVARHPESVDARLINADGRVVMPGFVDSHSHPVFAGPRLNDFEARLKGASYADLAAKGGGILSTVDGVRGATQAELTASFRLRCHQFIESGTTTLEAKSGYGLDVDSELKMLRAMRTAAEAEPLEIVPTFLGAHAVPEEMKDRKADYVRRVIEEMIPAVAKDKLARFADVFCEEGYFSLEEARQVLSAAKTAGLGAKVHAEQLSRSGGAALAVEAGACSADHLDCADKGDIDLLRDNGTVACLVPGSNYFLAKPYPPARALIDAGAAVALATDFNPGTCPCWDMRMILSIACTQMKMTPAEALVAATINGAHALSLGKTHGSLEVGKKADIICFDAEDYREIPYYFGPSAVSWVMKNGAIVHSRDHFRP